MTTPTEPPSLGVRDPGLLIGAMQRAAIEGLGKALETTLRQADDYLFDGTDHELTALRDLRRARTQIAQRFEQALINGFRRLSGISPLGKSDNITLSLLADDALEEQLANEQMADNLTRLHAPALELIEKRLAVLVNRPEVTAEENPVGPVYLAEAMRTALHAVELSTSVRIILYKFLERELGPALTPLYERMNASMVGAGILPLLKSTKRVEAPPQPAPAAPAANATAAMANAIASDFAMSGPGDQALFTNLIGLLQSWRQNVATSLPGQYMETGKSLQTREMLSVLSLMQPDPPASLQQALGDAGLSLPEQLRREVLAGARRLGMGGDNLNLSNTDEDAVDLVGMLFDVLLDERHFEPDVRRKISRMLVPYVKVAVKDRRMFLYKGHPARRLLNVVAEACEGNHGEGPQERELLDRVDSTIDRLVAEFNEDLAIFETLEHELRAFMDQHRKRIELAERRAAETQRGRERLEQARESVSVDLAVYRDSRELPPALDEFVSRYTHHHLTQIVLREGNDSPRYSEAMHALRDVLFAFDHAELGTPPEHLPTLRREPLLEILASSGCSGPAADDALATIQRTLAQVAAGEDVAANAAHLPEQLVPAAPPATEPAIIVVADKEALDFDQAVAERMRGLEIGTWLMLTSESGRVEPAKVSWVSPISSRLLFVNRRGIRVLVASAEELAAMAKLGKVQLREADNAFEDAMHQMMGRLQSSAQPA